MLSLRPYSLPRPKLDPPYSTALALLDTLHQQPQTLEQLAETLGLHFSTVSEYINCLSAGGVAIATTGTRTRGQATGRPEALYFLRD